MSEQPKLSIVIIVQARMGSTRLPGKVLMEVMGKPLLGYQIDRLKKVKQAALVIATTTASKDDPIVRLCQKMHVPVYRGSEEDVLDRYLQAAHMHAADVVVRVTSDCPLIDPQVIDEVISFYLDHFPDYDYVSNTNVRTFPRGMDTEVFSIKALEEAALKGKRQADREHVTYYLYTHPEQFNIGAVKRAKDDSHHRWTVDTPEDFQLIRTILEAIIPKKPDFTLDDLLKLLNDHPEWNEINAHVQQKNAED